MEIPGGWTMSMAWMRMPGQTWIGAGASFMLMWIIMMTAMMLPSLAPMLWRYRRAIVNAGKMQLNLLSTIMGLGYFFVWTVVGIVVFPIGSALVSFEMQFPALARLVPVAVGVIVLIAGALQFSTWKAHHLACCRQLPGPASTLHADASTAWRHGLRMGLHCCRCCGGLILILLAVGVMDLRAMALVAAAITIERLVPAGKRVAQVIGCAGIVVGLVLIGRAAGLG